MTMRIWAVALCLLFGATGCDPAGGGDGGDPPAEMGTDTRVDPPTDGGDTADAADDPDAAPVDAGPTPDGARDPDATPDGALDPDMGPDPDLGADPDALPPLDSGPEPDMSPDAGPPRLGCGAVAPNPGAPVQRQDRWIRIAAFESAFVGPRPIAIYLPPDYAPDAPGGYPVMYLHDGQNLFRRGEAAFGVEWQVDETVDALVAAGTIEPMIVVGVGNTPARIPEYTPSEAPEFEGSGQADAYGRFLVEELKPWVDAHVATRCAPDQTGVGGSSLGGLVSLHLRLRHPDVFGRIAALSPSLWWNDGEATGWGDALAEGWDDDTRVWIDGGNAEGDDPDGDGLRSVPTDIEALVDDIRRAGIAVPRQLAMRIVPGGLHNEAAWARRLPEVLAWLWGPPLEGDPARLVGGPVRTLTPGVSAPIRVDAIWPGPTATTLMPDQVALRNETPAVIDLADDIATGRRPGEARIGVQALGVQAELRFDVIADGQTLIEVEVPPHTPAGDVIYIAGSDPAIGDWAPDGFALTPSSPGQWSGVLPVEPGALFEFKVTRGTWETVEKGPDGEEVPNRIGLADGEPIRVVVAGWRDVPR